MEADFASVWSRVTGQRPAEDDITRLRRWIEESREGIRDYGALLRRRLPGAVRREISAISLQEKRRLRKLQSLHYLRTGDFYFPQRPKEPVKASVLQILRDRYASNLAQANSFRSIRKEPQDLALLCSKMAAENEARAARLLRLVEGLL